MSKVLQSPLRVLLRPLASSWSLGAPSPVGLASPCGRGFSSCPFRVLGLKSKRMTGATRGDHAVTFEQVRTRFRELALVHHPDTSSTGSSEEFTRIREAFEAIAEGPDGVAILRDDYSFTQKNSTGDSQEDDRGAGDVANHDPIYDERNGFLHSSVDPQVLREVKKVAEEMNPSGLDKGGMWAFANMVRNMAEDEGKGLPPLRVGGGDEAKTSKEKGSRLSKRRKRK